MNYKLEIISFRAFVLSCFLPFSIFAQSPYISKVFDYRPAPGQFVNVLPEYEDGDTHTDMLRKVEEAIVGDERGLVTLGAYGGYIVFGFDHLVENRHGKYDFTIWGNAYYTNPNPPVSGSCEPGIVMVSFDANGNGIPDDPWYELAGSEYHKPETIKNYEIIYYKPDPDKIPTPDPNFPFLTDTSYIKWRDNQEVVGYVMRNMYHKQPYYPQWISDETLLFEGAKLANNAVAQNDTGLYYIQYAYPWGYADNHPNGNIRSHFDIDWAVDQQGNKVNLPGIHFVKVYTGVNQYCGFLGETSSEITGAEDFHIQGIDIGVLGVQPDLFPDAKIYYSQGNIYLENIDDSWCTIYNINGQVLDSFYVNNANKIYKVNSVSGVYLLRIQKQNSVKVFKLIINH
jgi:hypothetical protein